MRGVVTRKHVLSHPVLIIQCWGLRAFLRALLGRTTFLRAISGSVRPDLPPA